MTILNRLGHGILESQLEEIETALAMKNIREKEQQGTALPSITHSSTFVTVCWDNNDIAEETVSGLGTTHCCTNGIVVQRQVSTALPKPKLPDHDEV